MCAKRKISNELCDRIEHVRERLDAHYGVPEFCPNNDPVGELVLTILSQHTTDTSAGRAFDALLRRFRTWPEVRDAPIDDVAEVIRLAGLPMQKARTIQTALRDIRNEPLTDLTDLPIAAARARLTAIKGIGDKTASCVLLFALGMPAQPVDTHIERVSKRIGINNGESSATGIQHVFEQCLPAVGQVMYAFHVDMVRHGREVCQARSPRCGMCVLSSDCNYFACATGATNV